LITFINYLRASSNTSPPFEYIHGSRAVRDLFPKNYFFNFKTHVWLLIILKKDLYRAAMNVRYASDIRVPILPTPVYSLHNLYIYIYITILWLSKNNTKLVLAYNHIVWILYRLLVVLFKSQENFELSTRKLVFNPYF
jgi:hypothetical protein